MVEEAEVHNPEVGGRAAQDDDRVLSLATTLYRDEMRRAVAWRGRLDHTTNWAVVLTASLLTWTFASVDHPHYVLLMGEIAVVLFLVIEARRYRMYDVWRSRILLLEENVFANAFDACGVQDQEWRSMMSEDLRCPTFKIRWIEAVQRRLRRVYLPIFLLIGLAWWLRVAAFSEGNSGIEKARIAELPGGWVVAIVMAFHLVLAVVTLWPMRRNAKGGFERSEKSHPAWHA